MERNIKQERALKLKMITAIDLISDELKSRNLTFISNSGVFEIVIKRHSFLFQTSDGETIDSCWTCLSEDRCFEFCEWGLSIEEFLLQLNDIIDDFNKLYKLKEKVEKQVCKIRQTIENSGVTNLEFNGWSFDEMIFENLICTNEI